LFEKAERERLPPLGLVGSSEATGESLYELLLPPAHLFLGRIWRDERSLDDGERSAVDLESDELR